MIAEGFDFHIEKPFIYGPIAFAICVEALNLSYQSREAKRNREARTEPVHLRDKYSQNEQLSRLISSRSVRPLARRS
jgi:hypothetical protein